MKVECIFALPREIKAKVNEWLMSQQPLKIIEVTSVPIKTKGIETPSVSMYIFYESKK